MVIRTDIEWVSVANEAYLIKQEIRKLVQKEEDLLRQLKALSQEKISFGGGYLFARETRIGSIDFKIIPELKGIDLEQYRKEPVIYWKLSKSE